MKFATVSRCFNTIESIDSRIAITEALAHLFKQATAQEAQRIAYLSLGELVPPYKNINVGIADKIALKVVAKLLDMDETTAQKAAQSTGDVSLLIEQNAWNAQKEHTVLHVYNELCALAAITGTGSQETKLELLSNLLTELDSLSARYVIRILTGKLRLGFSDMTVLDALSWMLVGSKKLKEQIEQSYMVCADIGLIAYKAVEGGIDTLKKLSIELGIPICPAAAERLPDTRAIMEKIAEPCAAQPKLDGFRLQIHINNRSEKQSIHFFSRNLTTMSEQFPDLYEALKDIPVETIIFEGEAITYDPETGAFLPFQETAKRKRKYDIQETAAEFPLQLFVFDILYLNGESLLAKPHKKRRAVAEKLFASFKTDRIFLIEEKICTTTRELETFFLEVVARGLEGLVVKKLDSAYLPGKRNFNWIKLKRKAQGRLEDTIDAVVFGYYFGKGKRTEFGIGSLLVGVYNKELDLFETIARVGTGLSDADWKLLKKKLDTISVHKKPHNISCASELEPNVWVNPELVCVIRAEEITMSPLHTAGADETTTGFALRFPRFAGYAQDKTATLATSVEEIKHLYQGQFA